MNANLSMFLSSMVMLVPAALSLALQHGGVYRNIRVLGESEVAHAARGGVPGPPDCATGFRTGNCEDYLAFCHSMPAINCQGQACYRCTNTGTPEQICSPTKPWNALTCQQNPDVAGGCGVFVLNTTCQWNNATGECECKGVGQGANCAQRTANSTGVGTCNVVN